MVRNLHIIGIDPGGVTGWCRITVPRLCLFGDQPRDIVEWDYGAFSGPETQQALEIARLARETQSLDYKVGPAILSEAWDQDPSFKSTDPEALSPVRINSYLSMLHYLTHNDSAAHVRYFSDATLNFQSRTIAMTTMTDDRLKRRGMYVNHKDIRAATRHALTGLRRATQDDEFRDKLWPEASH